jgi:hypothetical protein
MLRICLPLQEVGARVITNWRVSKFQDFKLLLGPQRSLFIGTKHKCVRSVQFAISYRSVE